MTVFLPSIHGGPTIAGQGEVDPSAASKAREIFDRMRQHPEQNRHGMVWHELLADVALARCKSMAHNHWTGHVDHLGFGPNYRVRERGYRLPDWYMQLPGDNNIESVGHMGDGTVEQIWQAWLASPAHRAHLLAGYLFFSAQTQVGTAYFYLENSDYKHYWSILTCPPQERL